jgi:hypothetical protein
MHQLPVRSPPANPHGCGRPRAGLAAGAGHPVLPGPDGGAPVRMDVRRPVATRASGRHSGNRKAGRSDGGAGPVDPARMDRGWRPLAAGLPTLCINRVEPGRANRLSRAQRAAFDTGMPRFLTAAGPAGPGSAMTTDRLITPFMCLRAQSAPRRLSPMNFSRGSRSTQRLLIARPSDFGSRGRA